MSGSRMVETRWGRMTVEESALLRLEAALVAARETLRACPDAAEVVTEAKKLNRVVAAAFMRIAGKAC